MYFNFPIDIKKTIPIGEHGLHMPCLGLGTGLHGEISEQQSVMTIEHALERGVNFFDTAPLYGNGLAEERLGKALEGVERSSFVINTKIGIKSGLDNGDFDYDFTEEGIKFCFERSLQRLKLNHIDILHIHEPIGRSKEIMNVVLPLMESWRDAGMIRAISAGVNHWSYIEEFVSRLDCILLAGRYTLLEQGAAEFLEDQHLANRPVISAGIFNSGILATGSGTKAKYEYMLPPSKVVTKVLKLEKLCKRNDVNLAQVAVQFVAANPAVQSMLFGACSPTELDKVLTCLEEPVPVNVWKELIERKLVSSSIPLPGSF